VTSPLKTDLLEGMLREVSRDYNPRMEVVGSRERDIRSASSQQVGDNVPRVIFIGHSDDPLLNREVAHYEAVNGDEGGQNASSCRTFKNLFCGKYTRYIVAIGATTISALMLYQVWQRGYIHPKEYNMKLGLGSMVSNFFALNASGRLIGDNLVGNLGGIFSFFAVVALVVTIVNIFSGTVDPTMFELDMYLSIVMGFLTFLKAR